MTARRSHIVCIAALAFVAALSGVDVQRNGLAMAAPSVATSIDQGKIEKIDAKSVTVIARNPNPRNREHRVYTLSTATKVELSHGAGRDRKVTEGKLADLRAGDDVHVEYESKSKAAVRIRRLERKDDAPGKPKR